MPTPPPTAPEPGKLPALAGMRRVFVRDFEIIASVGVFEHEKRYEQRILLSADLAVRDDYDGVSDRLEDVLDYSTLVEGIALLVQQEHVNLLETLAEVRIEKPDALPMCRSVGVEIERGRP
jgi:7,8-dihydroneopterin aldolase/epimerase/oxygenase